MMKKPMLNAIQKVKMSMAMKSKNPKMNPGFDSLPKEVQMKIMKSKKPKMAMMKKPMKVNKIGKKTLKADKKLTQAQQALEKDKVNKAMRKYKAGTRKAVKANVISKEDRKKLIKDAKYNKPANKPKMAMKKPAMMGDKKPKLAKDDKKKKVLQGGFGPMKPPKKKPKMAMKKPMLSKTDKKILRKKKAIGRKKSALASKGRKLVAKGGDSVTNSMFRKQMAIFKKKDKIKKAKKK